MKVKGELRVKVMLVMAVSVMGANGCNFMLFRRPLNSPKPIEIVL